MGKKGKVGKARKDKYYHLAKETGFRSRAAFKLLQLNRKFQFLEKSRVCIDLCAAPGGWLQVAQQHMGISSLILGVDLVPIKPIHNVMTFQDDITTEKCRQTLKKELHMWKADVVLHDGAPNVGQNWLHDAFQQAHLTLQALKLATEFLKKGGWFVSKVFRSKDYNSLLWVLKQLFKSVHATKPQASRNESAEMFLVCQYYKAPDVLDPKFLDVKHVFKDVPSEIKKMDIFRPEKVSKKAEGYEDGDTAFHHKLKVSEFLAAENHLELLATIHEIEFDSSEILNNDSTTAEIIECCKDIKVLGRKEIRSLLNWRKKLNSENEPKEEKENQQEAVDEDDSEAEEARLSKTIEELKESQELDDKKKRKKVRKDKRKIRDKLELQMIHPGDHIEETDDIDLFNIKKIKTRKGLEVVQKEDRMEDSEEESDVEKVEGKKWISYSKHPDEPSDEEEISMEEDNEMEKDEDASDESEAESDVPEENNPLIMDLDTQKLQAQDNMDKWFKRDIFDGLENEEEEDLMVKKMVEAYRKKGGTVIEKNVRESKRKPKQSLGSSSDEDFSDLSSDSASGSESDSDSDYDTQANLQRTLIEQNRKPAAAQKNKKIKKVAGKDGFEIVPTEEPVQNIIKLDPVELAMGEELIKSSKRKREIEENSYHRYTHGDEDLPDWFAIDESRHCRKQLPVTKEQIDSYKERLTAINSRPIKKIAEAKARKKRKMTKKLERVRKKAEVVSDNVEMTDREKWKQMKEIYKKAGLLKKKKKEVTYVVAKKGGGKKTSRPAGVKGFYKVVDKRMKKDKLSEKKKEKEKKGKKPGRHHRRK